MKKSLKLILASLLIVVIFTGLSVVSASDVNISDTNSSISTGNTNLQTSNLLIEEDNSNYQQNVGNSSDYSNEYSSNLNDVAVTNDGNVGSYSDLENLVNNSNGTVNLDKDYIYNPNTDTIKTVDITHNLTINGNGYSVSGDNLATIFGIYNSTVVFNDLSFINTASIVDNTTYSSGGGFYAENSTITMNNCNFINNHVKTDGGAFLALNSVIIVNNTIFLNNSASSGAIVVNNSDLTILNSIIELNSALGVAGVTNAQFSNLTIKNTNFINNTGYDNGAVRTYYSNANISDSNFISNIGLCGGAISSSDSDIIISNSSFESNGAIMAGAINFQDSIYKIVNSNFSSNYAEIGGAIYSYNSTGIISDSNFTSNIANNTDYNSTEYMFGGGAIELQYGFINLNNSKFTDNIATGNQTVDTANRGGALLINTASANVTNCAFNNNSAIRSGGAISLNYDTDITNGSSIPTLTVDNSYFTSNTANMKGGAIANPGNTNIINSGFISNSAGYGGAISSSNVTDNGSWFRSNSALVGGAIYSGYVYTSNTVLLGNNATLGGAIYSNTNVYSNYTSFVYNNATNIGGAIIGKNVILNNSVLVNNTAENATAIFGDNITVLNSILLTISTENSSAILFDENCNANYNWWGNNTPFQDENNNIIIRYINDTSYKIIKPDNWVIMALNMDNTNLTLGDTALINVNLNQYSNGNETFNMTNSIPELEVICHVNDGFTSSYTHYTGNGSTIFNYNTVNPGNYTVTVTTFSQSLSINFTVNPLTNKSTTLLMGDKYLIYGEYNIFNGYLHDCNGNQVANRTISLNYTRTSTGEWKIYNVTTKSSGYWVMPLGLAPGVYTVTGKFYGDEYYDPSPTNSSLIIIVKDENCTILIANTFKEKYLAGQNFTGKLMGVYGVPLINQTVAVKLTRLSNGLSKVYNVTTDSNGVYQLPINLGIGSYKAECSYNGTSEYSSSSASASLTVTA